MLVDKNLKYFNKIKNVVRKKLENNPLLLIKCPLILDLISEDGEKYMNLYGIKKYVKLVKCYWKNIK